MVAGFPTRIKTIGGKRVSFVRVGGHSDERALFSTKKQADDWMKFHRSANGIRCHLEKVHGGYHIWAEWKPVKERRKTGKKMRGG